MSEFGLDIAWDPIKAQANVAKHGVSFAEAASVLTDPLSLTVFDAVHRLEEERWFTLGLSASGRVLALAHTFQSTGSNQAMARIISARVATRQEQRQYERETRSMTTMNHAQDTDLPSEIDFSQGTRGQFYRPGIKLNLPIYLDDKVQARLASLANAKGIELSDLVNELLKKDIDLIEIAT